MQPNLKAIGDRKAVNSYCKSLASYAREEPTSY